MILKSVNRSLEKRHPHDGRRNRRWLADYQITYALNDWLGGLAGAVAFSYAQPWLNRTLLASGDGKIIFTDLIGIPYWVGALGFAAVLVIVLAQLERWRSWRDEMGRNVDGDFGASPDSPRVRAVPAE